MGIPFYFASLIKRHKGIVQNVQRNSPLNVDVFVIDFNCLIHRYLKDENPFNSVIEALEYILENFNLNTVGKIWDDFITKLMTK